MKISNQNIVLIGFMGCGKTTVGENLAFKLNYSFIDSDKEIQRQAAITISEIFELYGEDYFRQLENTTIKTICKFKRQVIATGGGTIKSKDNIDALKKEGIILYLKASAEHIYNNIKDDSSRPLLQCENKLERIKDLLSQRENLYEMYCDMAIEVSYCTVDDITNNIIKCIC